jgi:hypothetical protein
MRSHPQDCHNTITILRLTFLFYTRRIAVLDFQPNGVKGCRTILRVSYFTKLSNLREPQEDKESNSEEEDYLPAVYQDVCTDIPYLVLM